MVLVASSPKTNLTNPPDEHRLWIVNLLEHALRDSLARAWPITTQCIITCGARGAGGAAGGSGAAAWVTQDPSFHKQLFHPVLEVRQGRRSSGWIRVVYVEMLPEKLQTLQAIVSRQAASNELVGNQVLQCPLCSCPSLSMVANLTDQAG